MKISWLLALKIILVLVFFWVIGIVFLCLTGVKSGERILYFLLHDVFFHVFLVICVLGIASVILEKFYNKIKLSWLLELKIIPVLFWMIGIVFLCLVGVESREGIVYLLLHDVLFQVCLVICVLGMASVILERFYNNMIHKYFFAVFCGTACVLFLYITAQFLGFIQSYPKAMLMAFDELLILYVINLLLFCLVIFGIYGFCKKNIKMIVLGFFSAVLYIMLYIFAYVHIGWSFRY